MLCSIFFQFFWRTKTIKISVVLVYVFILSLLNLNSIYFYFSHFWKGVKLVVDLKIFSPFQYCNLWLQVFLWAFGYTFFSLVSLEGVFYFFLVFLYDFIHPLFVWTHLLTHDLFLDFFFKIATSTLQSFFSSSGFYPLVSFRTHAALIALIIVVPSHSLKDDVARYRVQISVFVNMIAMAFLLKNNSSRVHILILGHSEYAGLHGQRSWKVWSQGPWDAELTHHGFFAFAQEPQQRLLQKQTEGAKSVRRYTMTVDGRERQQGWGSSWKSILVGKLLRKKHSCWHPDISTVRIP